MTAFLIYYGCFASILFLYFLFVSPYDFSKDSYREAFEKSPYILFGAITLFSVFWPLLVLYLLIRAFIIFWMHYVKYDWGRKFTRYVATFSTNHKFAEKIAEKYKEGK